MEEYRKHLLDNYELDLSKSQVIQFTRLRDELYTMLSMLEEVDKDYSYYMKRYNSLKVKAEELGVTIGEPMKSASDIKTELVALVMSTGLTDKEYIKILITDEVIEMHNLPRAKALGQKLHEIECKEEQFRAKMEKLATMESDFNKRRIEANIELDNALERKIQQRINSLFS